MASSVPGGNLCCWSMHDCRSRVMEDAYEINSSLLCSEAMNSARDGMGEMGTSLAGPRLSTSGLDIVPEQSQPDQIVVTASSV